MTKEYDISYMVTHEFSIERILRELVLCQLLCGYCHQIKTAEDKLIKTAYYASLDEPLADKGPRIREGTLPNEIVVEIRRLYNTTTMTQHELAGKYDLNDGVVRTVVDNVYYHDPNYVRTRYDTTPDKVLSAQEISEIEQLLLANPTITIIYLASVYQCSVYTITKHIKQSKTVISDPAYVIEWKKHRDIAMNKDYVENKLTVQQVCQKYNLGKTVADSILRDARILKREAKAAAMVARDAAMVQYFVAGHSKEAIAKHYGVSLGLVQKIINKVIQERPKRQQAPRLVERNNSILHDYQVSKMTMTAIGQKYNIDGSHISRIIKKLTSN
ncbi:MAG: hypothetical protein H0X02_06315 [Nitrosomonas sp.]|nr:hypothetical protein [Nitrosomonas sp.]